MAVTLRLGDTHVFTTRPIGMKTTLYVRATVGSFSVLDWCAFHIELCCQDWRNVVLGTAGVQKAINISDAHGALVTVLNPITSTQPLLVWTDYV